MRLFVALALPETVRWQLRLLSGGLPGARWVEPENFHITLRFIGEVDGAEFHDIDAALAGIRAPSFTVSPGEGGKLWNATGISRARSALACAGVTPGFSRAIPG